MFTKKGPDTTTKTKPETKTMRQVKALSAKTQAALESAEKSPAAAKKTTVVIKYDVGYPNILTLRGKGANLSWDKGEKLTNVKHDEWIWETDASFSQCEFKVLINDEEYESGENHRVRCGASIQYTPQF